MTSSSVIVMWRPSSTASNVAAVFVGPQYGLYDKVFYGTTAKSSVVSVSGLLPATKYYYTVCSDSQCAPVDSSYYFTTSPETGTQPTTLRIHAMGDAGNGNDGARRVVTAVSDWMITSSPSRRADMWMMLGDDAYSDGSDSQYHAKVLQFYDEYLRNIPLWTTLGNHDKDSNSASQSGPYFALFKPGAASSTPSGTGAYYSYDYGSVHIVSLDSYYSSRAVGSPMLTWLANDLANIDRSKTQWLIAFWHHPVYSHGFHSSDSESRCNEMRSNVLPMLEAAGVDLVLNGHSHSYERSWLLTGHYGKSDTFDAASHIVQPGYGGGVLGGSAYVKPAGLTAGNGYVAVTSGSASTLQDPRYRMKHPAMVPLGGERNGVVVLGALVVDIVDNVLTVTFVTDGGEALDSFVIEKVL
jgi:acid phosphatase type 7